MANEKGGVSTGKGIAWAGLIGAGGLAAFFYFQAKGTGMPKNLKITSYENVNTGEVKTPPELLTVTRGESIRVNFEFEYRGPGFDCNYYAELVEMPSNMESEEEQNAVIDGSETWVTHEGSLILETDSALPSGVYALRVTIKDGPWEEDPVAVLVAAVNIPTFATGDDFEVVSCVADKAVVAVGETVKLTAVVKNVSDMDYWLIAIRFHIREEDSFVGGYHGEYFVDLPSGSFPAGGTLTVHVDHIAEEQNTASHIMRDVYVNVEQMIPGWDDTEVYGTGVNFEDVYEVAKANFTIGDLTVTPPEGYPGTVFELKFPVTNNSGGAHEGIVELLVRQGEWGATGDEDILETLHQPFNLVPGETKEYIFYHTGEKTHTGDDEEDERDVDVNLYIDGVLVSKDDGGERDWRYNQDGFIFGIIELEELEVTGVTVSPLSGDRWTNFNIVTNVYNPSGILQAFDLQIDIIVPPFLGIVDTKYYQGFAINPNTVLPIATNWVAYGVVEAGSYRANAKVIVNGVFIANDMSATFEVVSPTTGSFAVAPDSWPDLFPYPDATHWGLIWTTPEGSFSTGIYPISQWIHQFENVPLVGQLTFLVYIESVSGFVETYGPTAQVTLEDGAAYWYHWTNNTLVKSG